MGGHAPPNVVRGEVSMDVNSILSQVMAVFDHLGLITFVQAFVIISIAIALLRRILERQ